MQDYHIPRMHLMRLVFARLSDTVSVTELQAWLEFETGKQFTVVSKGTHQQVIQPQETLK